MTYLVDANVLSEPTNPRPAPQGIDWLRKHDLELLIDAVIAGEIWAGIDALPAGRKRTVLELWFAEVRDTVECLDWSFETAIEWGDLWNAIRRNGFTIGIIDVMIAATARQHGLTVATRNVSDFTRCGVPVINPFEI